VYAVIHQVAALYCPTCPAHLCSHCAKWSRGVQQARS